MLPCIVGSFIRAPWCQAAGFRWVFGSLNAERFPKTSGAARAGYISVPGLREKLDAAIAQLHTR